MFVSRFSRYSLRAIHSNFLLQSNNYSFINYSVEYKKNNLNNSFLFNTNQINYCTEANPDNQSDQKVRKPKRNKYDYWKLGFIDIIRNPQDHLNLFYEPKDGNIEKHNICVVHDRHPKAKKHLLIFPTQLLQKYNLLNESHIDLLEEMKEKAENVIKELKQTEDGKDLDYKIGFQAVPGMLQIHLHIISDDFESPHMKNKRHWNTFNTDFFVDPQVLIDQLKANGKIELDDVHYNNVIKQPLSCPHCGMEISRLPELKTHITAVHKK